MDETWVPDACTLPTVEQPLRVAEFGSLVASSLRGLEHPSATRLELTLAEEAAPIAADLTARESACCSFFRFDLVPVPGAVRLVIEVPEAQTAVLDALATRAEARLAGTA
ncbi:MAG TPA: hypothetical protein VIA06_22065 [Candidatus Dormibacteraeota bacterium]|jgi:hypothetical protein|nr:hypothetical protein [Candidatus Dormibacteraeota bacterium]